MINGVLNIDKPIGPTSHDVVDRVRRLAGQRKVGHGGTLDPFASGVLLILLGSSTKIMNQIHILKKTYELEITLGATSDTDDLTGSIHFTTQPHPRPLLGKEREYQPAKPGTSPYLRRGRPGGPGEVPSKEQITTLLQNFIGPIQQIPPAYAAIKVRGKKLYQYAREGKSVERTARPVIIYLIELLAYTYPRLQLRVSCGAGTYMRSLARDVGQALGVGGYASALRRTAIGGFTVGTAVSLATVTPLTFSTHLLQWPNATN